MDALVNAANLRDLAAKCGIVHSHRQFKPDEIARVDLVRLIEFIEYGEQPVESRRSAQMVGLIGRDAKLAYAATAVTAITTPVKIVPTAVTASRFMPSPRTSVKSACRLRMGDADQIF